MLNSYLFRPYSIAYTCYEAVPEYSKPLLQYLCVLVPIEDKHQITVVIGIQWRIQELGEGGNNCEGAGA